MTRYELLIEFPNGNRQYLNTFQYEPISLNYDIANIKDISARNSAYSKTIKLPDDAENREILGYITNLSVQSTVDANKVIKAWILVDTVVVFEGNLQLKKFDKNFKTGEFDIEVVVFADNDSFFTNLGDKYLTDIDFSEYDHIWATSSIIESWTSTFENGYVYPLIDYGSNWVYKDVSGYGSGTLSTATMSVSVDEMFPSTYVRPILDRIFYSNGFSYQSEFFNSTEFKRLIIPFNETFIQGPTSSDKEFRVGLYGYTHSYSPPSNSSPALKWIVPYDNEVTPNGDPNDLWNTTDFYFTNVDQLIFQRFGWYFNFTIPPDVGGSYVDYLWIHTYRSRDANGATNSSWASGTGNLVATRQIFYNNGSSYEGQWNPSDRTLKYGWRTPFINMFPNENLRIVVEFKFGNSPLIVNESYLFNELASSIPVGGQILYNNCIPKKVKQKDFFLSLCRMFNLYIEPSKEYANTLIIEPRDDYYANGTIKDWTSKLDLNQNIESDILAQTQDKIIFYSHKEDKDALNQDYKSAYNEIYGQYEYISPNEFAKSTKKIETIFSPTPLASLLGSFNFPIPVIVKDFLYSYNNTASGRIQSNLRILYWGGLINFSAYGITDQFGFANQIYPYFPYAGHLDNPYYSSYDINFGQPENIYFREPQNGFTDNNLFNTYWYKTMKELTNPDSRLLTCNFFLNSQDIYNFRFSDQIYLEFDGNGQYYKVNKIFDYDPGTSKTCKVELIKSDEVQVNTFVSKYKPIKPFQNTRPNVASSNKVEGSGTGLVSGNGNELNGNDTHIYGDNNVVSGDNSVTYGDDNTVSSNNTITNGDLNDIDVGGKSIITNGDENKVYLGVGDTFINGDENKIYSQVDKSITSGDNNSVGTYSVNIYTYGDNNTTGTASQNVYIFGNDNTIADGVTSSFIIGDNVNATQSNSVYISGNIILSGTISGSFSIPIGLQDVLDYDNIVDDTQFSIEPNNLVNLGRNSNFFSGATDSYFQNSQFSYIYDSIGSSIQSSDFGFLRGGQFSSIRNSKADLFVEQYLINSIFSEISFSASQSTIFNSTSSNISFGENNIINASNKSFIQNGSVNDITSLNRTGIMLLDNITATMSDTLYVPNIKSLGDVYIDGDLYVNGSSIAGQTGPQGFQGIMGVQGATFFGGPQGNVGSTGPQGFQGFQGFQGIEGSQGFQGNEGFQGYTGPQGFEGAQGFQGYQGNTGFQGPTYTPPLWDVLLVGNRTDSQILSMTGSKLIIGSFTNSMVGGGRYDTIIGGNGNTIELQSGNLHGYNFMHGDSNHIYGVGSSPNDSGFLNFVHGQSNFLTYSLRNTVFGSFNYIKGTRFTGGNFIAGDVIKMGSDISNNAIFGQLHTLTGSSIVPNGYNIISGYGHGLTNSSYCGIIGGNGHSINGVTNSVILGGINITATQSNTVYVPNFISKSDTPSISVGAGAGTSPTYSISGTNISGIITITTGTLPSLSSIIATVTNSNGFTNPNGISVVLFPANGNTATLSGVSMVFANGTNDSWTITSGASALTAATTYTWNYQVVGY